VCYRVESSRVQYAIWPFAASSASGRRPTAGNQVVSDTHRRCGVPRLRGPQAWHRRDRRVGADTVRVTARPDSDMGATHVLGPTDGPMARRRQSLRVRQRRMITPVTVTGVRVTVNISCEYYRWAGVGGRAEAHGLS
jgi:hypothetical protein